MRIWSLHPKYLDTKGLVALWRETLLAKNVLEGNTKGYRNHPQLDRFKAAENPLDCINQYLAEVYHEAVRRGYNFNKEKIEWNYTESKLSVNDKQMDYELVHLKNKLEVRDPEKLDFVSNQKSMSPHPLFTIVKGPIEVWEILK